MNRLVVVLLLCFTATSLLSPRSRQASGSQEKVVTAAQVNGTWKYRGNIFNIWALGQQRLKVEFIGTYEYKTPTGPMANTGSASGIARIEGNTATLTANDSSSKPDEPCKIDDEVHQSAADSRTGRVMFVWLKRNSNRHISPDQ